MNTYIPAAFRRLSWKVLLAALMFGAALQTQAQSRPADPPWLIPPKVDRYEQPPDARIWRYVPLGPRGTYRPVASIVDTDTRIWRYVPIGPRGTYRPVTRIVAKPSAPPREVVRWVGPRGTVPVYRDD